MAASRTRLRSALAALAALAVSAAAVAPDTDAAGAGPAAPHTAAVRPVALSTAGGGDRAAPAGHTEGRYRWPTGDPVPLVRPFVAPLERWQAGHRGVDLELAAGSPVRAAADGVVVFAGTVVDRPVVSVEHPDGIRTTYEPVDPDVSAGESVRAGQVLGRLRAGHCPAWRLTTCLHLGARTGPDEYVDPMVLLGADVVVRLLPATMDLAG